MHTWDTDEHNRPVCAHCAGHGTIEAIDLEPEHGTKARHYWAIAIEDDATHYCTLCGARYADGCDWY